MRIFLTLSLLTLTACQTTEIRQAYVDPQANIGAAEAPTLPTQQATAVRASQGQVAINKTGNVAANGSDDLNTTSWVELRMTPLRASTPAPSIAARSIKRPLALLPASGELMNPADFPNRFLASP